MKRFLTIVYRHLFWLVSGVLLAFSFPNSGVPFLGYVALVPSLYRSYKDGYLSVIGGVLTFSIVFWWITANWFSTFHPLAPLGIIFALYLYSVIPFAVSSVFSKKYGEDGLLVFPFLWVGFEFLRGNGYWSMPIILLAHTQYHFAFSNSYLMYLFNGSVPMLGEWGGVYFVSFLVALMNSLIFITFMKIRKGVSIDLVSTILIIISGISGGGVIFSLVSLITNFKLTYVIIFLFSFVIILVIWFVCKRLDIRKFFNLYSIFVMVLFFSSGVFVAIDRDLWYRGAKVEEIKVALLQPNFSPWDKLLARDFSKLYEVIELYKSSTNADFIIACESILRDPVNFYYNEGILFGVEAMSIAKKLKKPLILTYPHLEFGINNTFVVRNGKKINVLQQVYRYYNTALFFDGSGKIIGRYDKVHLVPFGEWTPFSEYIPPLRKIIDSIVGTDLTPGDKFNVIALEVKPLEVKPSVIVNFGPIICFEDLYPYISKLYKVKGVDILVNMTNDGWANSIKSQWQHLVGAIYRVIETGLPMARATNTGRSAFILQNGKVVSNLDDFKKGFDISQIKLIKRNTFFVLIGDHLFTLILLLGNAFIVFLAISDTKRFIKNF